MPLQKDKFCLIRIEFMYVIYINFMLQTAVSQLRWSSLAWIKF